MKNNSQLHPKSLIEVITECIYHKLKLIHFFSEMIISNICLNEAGNLTIKIRHIFLLEYL